MDGSDDSTRRGGEPDAHSRDEDAVREETEHAGGDDASEVRASDEMSEELAGLLRVAMIGQQHPHPPTAASEGDASVAHDRWAHRRGEPRMFTFFWLIYLLCAVGGSVLWSTQQGPVSSGTYSPAARILLVVIGIGATVLWPMVRLSQRMPRRHVVREVLVDLQVIVIPAQSVLIPLCLLAQWPTDVVAGVSVLMVVWPVLIGGVLVWAYAVGRRDTLMRSAWMGVIVAAVFGVLALGSLSDRLAGRTGNTGETAWWGGGMSSPLSAVYEISGHGMAGAEHPVTGAQWASIGLVGAVGAMLWITGCACACVRNRRANQSAEGSHSDGNCHTTGEGPAAGPSGRVDRQSAEDLGAHR